MPRPFFASRCRADSPLPCVERYGAMRTGPGIWKAEGRGWYWVHDGRIEDGVTHCPFCGFPLPQTEQIVRRLAPKRNPWESSADGWRGEP